MMLCLVASTPAFTPGTPGLVRSRAPVTPYPRMVLDPAVLQSVADPVTASGAVGVVVSLAAVRQAADRRATMAAEAAELAAAEAAAAAAAEAEDGELSIKQLLQQYGVIAVMFHFTVWISTLTLTYTALSVVGVASIANSVPMLAGLLGGEGGDAAAATGSMATLGVTLGLVEAIGPARLALTVAATPAISERAREFELVRDTEARIMEAASGLFAKAGLGGEGE
jgi:hypothetical protein